MHRQTESMRQKRSVIYSSRQRGSGDDSVASPQRLTALRHNQRQAERHTVTSSLPPHHSNHSTRHSALMTLEVINVLGFIFSHTHLPVHRHLHSLHMLIQVSRHQDL
ncbi:hypothetical protein E2C01_048715 [Portunus trituberculatus]|uniref:Uncharacterized protein n=1 Tax=Portunus trituberculatus TaxID=210409 RepID=A0A5B7GAX4_PORTR|nr:hypothetical protein [Portunus trituberculatus]